MSDIFAKEIMTTNSAIKEYNENHGNTLEIDRYYKTFGTYKGIEGYSQRLTRASSNN